MLWGSDGRDGYWSYWMGEVVAFVLSWPTRFCLSSVSVDLPPPAVKPLDCHLPPATPATKKSPGRAGQALLPARAKTQYASITPTDFQFPLEPLVHSVSVQQPRQ